MSDILTDRTGTTDTALVSYEKRSYKEEMTFLEKITPTCYRIKKGFVPNMRVRGFLACTHAKVEGRFYVNQHLETLCLEELEQFSQSRGPDME